MITKLIDNGLYFADDSRELEDPDIELRMIDAVDVDKEC